MKLYFSPGASSLGPHIALRESGMSFALERVSNKTKKTASDADYHRINHKAYVPALQFDDGTLLTEVVAIMLWVADQVPERHLAPSAGTMERYHVIEWLTFVSSELHKSIGALFVPAFDDGARRVFHELADRRLAQAQKLLGDRPFVVGEHFSVADAYLFNVLNWLPFAGMDLSKYPQLAALHGRVAARPKVQEALAAEGLNKSS